MTVSWKMSRKRSKIRWKTYSLLATRIVYSFYNSIFVENIVIHIAYIEIGNVKDIDFNQICIIFQLSLRNKCVSLIFEHFSYYYNLLPLSTCCCVNPQNCMLVSSNLQWCTAAVTQWVRAFTSQAEGWLFESQPRQTQDLHSIWWL